MLRRLDPGGLKVIAVLESIALLLLVVGLTQKPPPPSSYPFCCTSYTPPTWAQSQPWFLLSGFLALAGLVIVFLLVRGLVPWRRSVSAVWKRSNPFVTLERKIG